MIQTLTTAELLNTLRLWQQAGWIRHLDVQFARFAYHAVSPKQEDTEALPVFIAALLSWQLNRGHVCLDLPQLLKNPEGVLELPPAHSATQSDQLALPGSLLKGVSVEQIIDSLQASELTATDSSPLVLTDGRVYLRRYWQYEQTVVQGLTERMEQMSAVDETALQQALNQNFDNEHSPAGSLSWQKIACASALRSGFTVITGGPGTGKTYTVVRILRTLRALKGENLIVKLAAPTGKAAARMTESVRNELSQSTEEEKQTVPVATTLHRLLGSQRHTRAFRHNRTNPLRADVVIVDEASMVDLENMAALVKALPEHCVLILLGDKDQLASVEAGAVLGQLCEGADQGGYTEETLQWLQRVTGIATIPNQLGVSGSRRILQHVVKLHESRRFDDSSGIGKLAREINAQRPEWIHQWLQQCEDPDTKAAEYADSLSYLPCSPDSGQVKRLCIEGYQNFNQFADRQLPEEATDAELDDWAESVLNAFNEFRVLCVQRKSATGVQALNEKIRQWLQPDVLETWFPGRPVMVTRNDYSQRLTNGDIGVLLRRRPSEQPRVAFLTTDPTQKIRWVLPSRLVNTESAYAMTVHKSQGSEFGHTVLVLPDRDSPVLTKELLYTGVTRAKSRFTLVAERKETLVSGLSRAVQRSGGLTRSPELSGAD